MTTVVNSTEFLSGGDIRKTIIILFFLSLAVSQDTDPPFITSGYIFGYGSVDVITDGIIFDEYSEVYEPFLDEDASDAGLLGRCDNENDWTSRCPNNNNYCINIISIN